MSAHPAANRHGEPSDLDLSLCEQEQIHIPGAIQPHGAVLAVLAESLLVSHASENLASILGRPAEAVLGRPLTEAVGEQAFRMLLDGVTGDGVMLSPTLTRADGETLILRAYRSGQQFCVDIKPIPREPQQRPPVVLVQSVLETFKHAASRNELCELAVAGLRAITGYDRVMAYRFHEDGHGEVIAEARTARLEPYLGLQYPASDIPPQARRLYLRQRVVAIADANYHPVPLLADPGLDDGTPVDLTHSAFRSASPIHRQYMRNMKTAASLTIGLAYRSSTGGQHLWGMLVCHHSKPRIAGPELRAVADMIGQVVSLLLGSLGEAEVYAQRLRRNTTLRALIDRLAEPMPLSQAFAAAEAELLDLVDAGGAAICLAGTVFCVGETPSASAIAHALAILQPAAADGVMLAIDDLGLRHPELGDCTAQASGVLMMPFAHAPGEAILWFRPELAQAVVWAGNPSEHATADPVTGQLRPRTSFAAWKELVCGRSAPWTAGDLAVARELRTAIAMEVAQRTKAELAKLRYYDSLTGLPNRLLLQEMLQEAEREPGPAIALLFLDLDRFKAVNDTMGHAAGDMLLIEVGRRLVAVAGPKNMPARLGGDEFVVLCKGLHREALAELAERTRQAIEVPYEIAGRPCHISASIGIAVTSQTGGLELLRAADMAMYAAKERGGNGGVMFEPTLFSHATEQFELEQEMREALSRGGQFELHYQPMFMIDPEAIYLVGFEGLVRWMHPRHGWMVPEQFLPLAKKSGLVLPLENWVLTTALRQGRVFQQAQPGRDVRMAVNVSVSQLSQDGFCSGLSGTLEAEGFPPEMLCLEVTDSIVANPVASAVLAEIRKLGVHAAIDDFGVGTSSIAYLRRLPVDFVKLDRGFLGDLDVDPRGEEFVGAVVALAHAAGMRVVFEGIDTQAQRDIAVAAGADLVQGFFFAPPLSASAAEAFAVEHGQLENRHILTSAVLR